MIVQCKGLAGGLSVVPGLMSSYESFLEIPLSLCQRCLR